IPLRHLELWLDDWLSDCEVAQFSRRTIEGRRVAADRLLRFLREQDETECGVRQLRKFFGWLRAPDGNINAMRRNKAKALSHNTIATYYERLQTFYNWLTERRLIEASPFDELPIVQRKDEEIRILSPQ